MVIIAVIAIGGGTAGAVILGLQGSDEALCRELLAKSAKLDFAAMAQMEDKNCERFISTEEMMEATIGGSVDLYNDIVSPDRQVEEPTPTRVEPEPTPVEPEPTMVEPEPESEPVIEGNKIKIEEMELTYPFDWDVFTTDLPDGCYIKNHECSDQYWFSPPPDDDLPLTPFVSVYVSKFPYEALPERFDGIADVFYEIADFNYDEKILENNLLSGMHDGKSQSDPDADHSFIVGSFPRSATMDFTGRGMEKIACIDTLMTSSSKYDLHIEKCLIGHKSGWYVITYATVKGINDGGIDEAKKAELQNMYEQMGLEKIREFNPNAGIKELEATMLAIDKVGSGYDIGYKRPSFGDKSDDAIDNDNESDLVDELEKGDWL